MSSKAVWSFVLAYALGGVVPVQAVDIETMAREVSSGVGSAKIYPGSSGTPVVVFEERHDSYTMALEESVALIRLHNQYGLNDIGLEGYTDNDPPWTPYHVVNIQAAVTLLKNSEVNSAAFMALGYGVEIHPIEKASEYVNYENVEGLSRAISEYAIKAALEHFKTQLKNNEVPPEVLREAHLFEQQNDIIQLQRLLINQDPFAKEKLAWLNNSRGPGRHGTAEEIDFYQSFVDKAKELHLQISENASAALNGYIQFLRSRDSASTTMANNVISISSSGMTLMAMIIGIDHTNAVVRVLHSAGRPVVVISPFASPPGGREVLLSPSQFEALYRGDPLEKNAFTKALRDLGNVNRKQDVKPRQDFNATWLQTKSEVYAKIDGVVRSVYGGGAGNGGGSGGGGSGGGGSGGGDGGGLPPNWSGLPPDSPIFRRFALGLPDDHGKRVRIDKTRLEFIKKDETISIVFPIQIISPENKIEKEFWVRAWPSKQNSRSIESSFTQALPKDDAESQILDRLKEGKGPELEEAAVEEIEVSKLSVAVVGPTKESVLNANVPRSLK